MEDIWSHFGQWWAVAVWIIMFGVFLAFIPFYKKSQIKPAGAFMAFVVALAFEMFGIPLSMYVITWVFGYTLPEGVLWGHTLVQYIGYWGTYFGSALYIIGGILIILGWRNIHKHYWSKEAGKGRLVTGGIYAYIRHPQYTGFLLITLGMIFEWATIPLLIMWPILVVLYYRLAKKEEQYMEEEFGPEYIKYKSKTGMFLPIKYSLRRMSF
ncbi:Isoprenylcysteine carboxyl methyltransferase (ICMT) family protein [Sporotomaculum syntrophicum]|uniref:Isoprenylcysteine carboxyl methyltransferase (ICMT) family protein n=1 Tax=Sporotomaculum syntrophicum TaxID=182264 RepID=A0A9D2WT82_9FIRM|nr:isoprenylcysteine carboxylmethyltransferase family protein [Sporotomaculum syntrophicum]KAF1086197.1 Isoprenylcysteine carboxyl methyltransferase (ICMT) family protein [Sporotomaculum syntrophicum]